MQKIWRTSLATMVASLLFVGPLPARAQDDFSFEIVEDKAQDTDTARYTEAKDLLAQERFGEALAALESILGDKKLKKFHPAAEYDIAKALFRMGAFHAALTRYQAILDDGPKHEYYAQARQWLFFISRKMRDELAPLQMISVYARSEDIPAEQQSELSYALARYYFLNALNQGARGVEVEQSAEPPPDAAATGDSDTAAPSDEGTKDTGENPADEGGFNFSSDDLGGGDDDGFDFSDIPKKGKKAKKAKASKKPPKEEPKAAEPKAEPAPSAEPPKEKTHKRGNPKSAEESLDLALKSAQRVKEGFPAYAEAVYLKGLAHFARGEFDPAVKAFREVVVMTKPSGGTVDNPKLREMAFFSLARIHYQFEQFRYAVFYYDRISRDSEQWLDALFESSWAHFRLGEYEKALGNLVTLQSPFFLDEYYPEASILKAITFYENCRYPEARAFLGEFKQNYGGVGAELERLVGTGSDVKSAEQLFEELTTLEQKVAEGKDDAARSIALTARLLRLALSDKRVAGYRDAIAEVDEEKQKLMALDAPFNGGAIHAELIKGLDERRVELVKAAGGLLRDRLGAEGAFLQDLTSKLVRIQFEIAKMEKETLEASLSNQNQAVSLGDYRFTTATDDERLYWPFEGEYWRDELGTYQYTLTRGCRPPSETTITGN